MYQATVSRLIFTNLVYRPCPPVHNSGRPIMSDMSHTCVCPTIAPLCRDCCLDWTYICTTLCGYNLFVFLPPMTNIKSTPSELYMKHTNHSQDPSIPNAFSHCLKTKKMLTHRKITAYLRTTENITQLHNALRHQRSQQVPHGKPNVNKIIPYFFGS